MIRPGPGIHGYERALRRAGFSRVAGADEAGRGACAGPMVAAAVVLADTPSRRITGLADSKLLTARARDRVYDEVMAKALAVAWVRIEPDECAQLGMHEADIQGLRRALLRLDPMADYVLTDGFPVDGLGVPGLAVWKGDRVAACVAAASVVAKVTRDRLMADYARQYPQWDFDVHKGYTTKLHQQRLEEFGPSPIHRPNYANVRAVMGSAGAPGRGRVAAP